MSASRSSPTNGINLIVLPLSPVTVSLHYLPESLRLIVTCGKTPTTIIRSASSNICCHAIQQKLTVEQFVPKFRNLPLHAEKRI